METQTIAVTVKKNWMDGGLTEEFAQFGYGPKWRAGAVRNLPASLLRKVEASGAEIAIPAEGAPEDFVIHSAPPTIPTDDQVEQLAKERMQNDPTVRVLFLKRYKNGNLSPEFAALGHPPWFGFREIAELPLSLYEKLESDGAPMSRDKDALREFDSEHFQLKHQVAVLAWRKEREADKALAAQIQADAPRLARIREQIETLSARLLKTNPNTKTFEALQFRIDKLHEELYR